MSVAVERFLSTAGWDGADRAPLAGDASARRYVRLTACDGDRAVLMIAPPANHASLAAFRAVAAYLAGLGLSAPRILASDADAGLMLLEDFGDRLLARLARADPGAEARLYHLAAAVAERLRRAPPMAGLEVMDPETMVAMTGIAFARMRRPDEGLEKRAAALMLPLFVRHLSGPPVTVLRDFHAENLIELPGRSGPARIGLLDFQDAVLGPAGYDLVSLADDVRRDVPDALRDALFAEAARAMGLSRDEMALRVALLGLQRNIRILGVFSRLAEDHGKPGYLAFLPRLARLVRRAAAHPELAALAGPVETLLRGHGLGAEAGT